MERESRRMEYKRTVTDFRKLAKTVVALANGDGGRIIVGVDDRTRNVTGLSPQKIDELLERLPVSLADQIRPPLYPQVFERTVEDKEVLIIQVYPANQKPCFIASEGVDKGVYVRVGSHTRRASGELLEELRLHRSRLGYDEAPIAGCPVTELDSALLPRGLRTQKGQYSLGVFRRDPLSGDKVPVRGAVLMLHHEPERYVPEAYIVISRMRGDRGRSTVETHDLTGAVPRQSDAAVSVLERWLGRDPSLKGSRYRSRKWALPLDAVREAVNNALFHRQYSIPGAIKVALYATRLEVFSPGHFAGPFIPDSLGDGTSYIRNRVLCTLARRMGLIEKRGTGIKLIQDAMDEAGLPAPVFEEGALWFRVTLNMVSASRADSDGRSESANLDRIMELFEIHPEISSSQVCEALKVSRATAVSYLGRLASRGKIVKTGKGPKTRYRPRG